MKFVALNLDGVSKNVIENLIEYKCEFDKFTYKTADGEYGVLSYFSVGYCVVEDSVDVETIDVPYVADFLKKFKIEELTAACNAVIDNGFTYTNGDAFSFDLNTQNEFTQKQMLFMFYPTTETVQLRTLNNGTQYYTRSDFMDLVLFANAFRDNTQKRLTDLVTEIKNTKYTDIKLLKDIIFS